MNVVEQNLRAKVERLEKRVRLLEALLQETNYMHLRYEKNREWLARRDHVLGMETGGGDV